MTTLKQPSVFGSPALDEAAAGIAAGLCSTVCMQPLDLLKVKFQVAQARRSGPFGQIMEGLQGIVKQDGIKGLYRGLNVNLVGNAASWGAYFLWCVIAAIAPHTLQYNTYIQMLGIQPSKRAKQGKTHRSVYPQLNI